MRLQKYIAKTGYTSRRKAELLISSGRVKLNGQIVTELGTKVDELKDKVSIDDKCISLENKNIYILLNKPTSVLSSVSDDRDRKTVIDLIDGIHERIYPVGRLDYNTSGLLILTNDGEFTNIMTHPKYHIAKTYIVRCSGSISNINLKKLQDGIHIDNYLTKKAVVNLIKKTDNISIVKIRIFEGRNRQIRKMFDAINHPVIRLKRVAIGSLTDDKLPIGSWRNLTQDEIDSLRNRGLKNV